MNYSGSYSNTDDFASATSPNPWAMGDYAHYPNLSVPQSTYPDPESAPGYPSTGPNHIPDFNAADDAAFSLPPTAEMGAFALPIQADYTNQNIIDPWSMPGPSHFDANSAVPQPQLVGVQYWTGVDALAAYSAATTPDSGVSPTSTNPTSQDEDEYAWLDDYLSTPCTTPASSPGYGGEAIWVAPEHGANGSEVATSLAGWDTSGLSWPIPAAPGDVTSNVTMVFPPAAALGKRRREAEEPLGDGGAAGTHSDEMPPKQAKGGGADRGVLKAARSAARTRRKPAARIPKQQLIRKPKEAGRGAERLATPSSQGIYHQSLPGPSFQQGWLVDAADGKPTWVEGSVDEEVVHHTDSTMQQQHEETTELFTIPRKLRPEHRLLLQTSEADVARGAIQAIKCRLCPDTNLKDFEKFKKHCETSETHPLVIRFCDHCGDYFARVDSLNRHSNLPPAKCRKVTPAMAAEKRRVTEEAHGEFVWRLQNALMTGGDVGRGFSEIIKERYPASIKKPTGGSKQ